MDRKLTRRWVMAGTSRLGRVDFGARRKTYGERYLWTRYRVATNFKVQSQYRIIRVHG